MPGGGGPFVKLTMVNRKKRSVKIFKRFLLKNNHYVNRRSLGKARF